MRFKKAGTVLALSLISVFCYPLLACVKLPSPSEPTPEKIVLELQRSELDRSEEAAEETDDITELTKLTDQVDLAISAMSLGEKVSGLLIVTIGGLDSEAYETFLSEIPAAGFLMGRANLAADKFTIRNFIENLQNQAEFPLVFAVDQEGSPVARISGDRFPGARKLGMGDPVDTAEAFVARQQLVDAVGANVNFGLIADVSLGPRAYIHPRSFSTDVDTVADHVKAALVPVPEVAQTLKHFPGHGLVLEDSHRMVPRSEISFRDWRLSHAIPFEVGIQAGADLVMMGHIRVPAVSKDPATLSDDWVQILRHDLGFEGVIITDDLRMLLRSGEESYQQAPALAIAALQAGNDLLLMAVDPASDPTYETYREMVFEMEEAVRDGRLSEERVNESLRRVLMLRSSLGVP